MRTPRPDEPKYTAEEEQRLMDYFDRDDDLTEDEETDYRWLLRVLADQ